jgi:NAD(P)-dependent dehydrogenase (short-subunit alcohol dehydrogenase family)
MRKLEGKVVLITGGTSGIGAATAKLFQKEGAAVIVTGSNPATLAAAHERMDGIDVVASDSADTVASKALLENVKSRYGRLDVLFVNAGIAQFSPSDAVDEAFYDAQFSVNVRGAYFAIRHAAPVMSDGGAIILTSSIAGVLGSAGQTVYGATKAAVRSFGRTFAGELAPRRIRVNTISPGPIETPIFGKFGFTPEQATGMLKGIVDRVPLGRIGRSEEIARAALFLASDDSSFITGTEMFVDGGIASL